MHSKTDNDRSNAAEVYSSGRLTDAQKEFAAVVGRALAEAWHRTWRDGYGRLAVALLQVPRPPRPPSPKISSGFPREGEG